MELTEKLKELQIKEGLSNRKFASRLGISHQLWQMTRTGKRGIGLTLLKGIVRAYSEFNRDVLIFLAGDVYIKTTDETNGTEPHQTHRASFQRALQGLCGVFYRVKKLVFYQHKAKSDTKPKKVRRGEVKN